FHRRDQEGKEQVFDEKLFNKLDKLKSGEKKLLAAIKQTHDEIIKEQKAITESSGRSGNRDYEVICSMGREIISVMDLIPQSLRYHGGSVILSVTPNVPASSARSLYAAMLNPQGRFLYEEPRVEERIDPSGSEPGSGRDDVVLLADVDSSVLDELVDTFNK
ncbi:hypothetical protein Tco_1151162, partial [Tanacetum coccineum]